MNADEFNGVMHTGGELWPRWDVNDSVRDLWWSKLRYISEVVAVESLQELKIEGSGKRFDLEPGILPFLAACKHKRGDSASDEARQDQLDFWLGMGKHEIIDHGRNIPDGVAVTIRQFLIYAGNARVEIRRNEFSIHTSRHDAEWTLDYATEKLAKYRESYRESFDRACRSMKEAA